METLKPTLLPMRGRAALLASACLFTPLMAGEMNSPESVAATEAINRQNAAATAVTEAQELLAKGDEAYNAGRYSEAVEAYSGARDLIPSHVNYSELKMAVTIRYVQASVESARAMVRKGDVDGAKSLMDKVISSTPDGGDPTAVAYRAQLDDPIRTNPALDAEHAQNMDEVRRELYTAEGAYNLGNFDDAKAHYEKVLLIDPYNSAARRGMERVAVAKSDYYKSADDHTRAEMLMQVEKAWELPIVPKEPVPVLGAASSTNGADYISVSNKLERIIIPRVTLEQTSLEEAVQYLRLVARDNDTLETDSNKKGVNITLNLAGATPEVAQKISSQRFDLRLTNVPVGQVLRYITQTTQTSFTTDEFSVIIGPVGSSSAALTTRTYRVPPDFVSSISNGGGAAAPAEADPFGDSKPSGGLLAKKMSVQEALAGQGISFPQGASASFAPGTGTLVVTNTEVAQDQVAQLVETTTQTEPVAVVVRVTMIKAQETTLKELGFDWMLNEFGFGGPAWVPGASLLNLTGGTQGNGSSLSDIVLPTGLTANHPITSGNRSGDAAISKDSIDAVIAGGSVRPSQTGARAPGVFGLNGILRESVLQVMVRGLDQKKGVDMLQQPSVVTRSGQAASVHIVREFIYPTEYEPPELPNNTANTSSITIVNGEVTSNNTKNSEAVTPATPTAFEKRDVGTILEVLPTADANKHYVDVTIKPTFTEFEGFVNYGTPINTTRDGVNGPQSIVLTDNSILMPVFSVQRTSTSVTIADGSTIVIAGLMKEKMQTVNDKIPILGDLPAVGRLFQSKATSPEKTAIIFLVNVELLDPTGHPYRNR